ncbi:MAG: hypothetical protein PHU21_11375, partial [Elusimicrobia bacterium]|nr:hypothetical protein [Elusimicrobiota bacterium]
MRRTAAVLALALAASSLRAATVAVPDCAPPKPYNKAQAWWMTQLPPPGDSGARTAMAVISLPVYVGCAVLDVLAFPLRVVYNAGPRCSERKRALAAGRELDSEIAKAQERRAQLKEIAARTPPQLALWAEFDDSGSGGLQRDGRLDAEETAQLRLTVRNEGTGPAHEVSLFVERESGPADVIVGEVPALGDLPAGRTKILRVPISAAESLSGGNLVLRVAAKEELGYDADPILLVIPAAALAAPDLAISEIGLRDGAQELALGAPVSLRLRVTNQGEGLAREVKVRL